MRLALILLLLLALTACAGKRAIMHADPVLPPEVITIQTPPKVIPVEKLIYVSIPSGLTEPIPHDELPTWQCIPERDQLRAKVVKANGDRAATRSIQGSSVKGAKP